MRRVIVIVLCLLLALVVAAPMATAQQKTGTGVGKKQIGELSAAWWQQVMTETKSPECGPLEQDVIEGDVFYLANFSGQVDAECTVPSGSRILAPVFNVACSPQFGDQGTVQDLRDLCRSIFDYAWKNATDVEVTVDGQEVEEESIVCADAPLFNLTVPKGSFSIKAGFGIEGTGPAVASGCWILLEPLSPGEHIITIEGTFPLNPDIFGTDENGEPFTFTQTATYTLTVE